MRLLVRAQRGTVVNAHCGGFGHLSFSGGVRTKHLIDAKYAWVKEGINSHWFCTGYREPVTGVLSNNSSVRIRKI